MHQVMLRVKYEYLYSSNFKGGVMTALMDRAKRLIGSRISIKNDDYGIVVDVVAVVKNDMTFVVVVTDKNKRVEALSMFRNLTSATNKKVYPDGTDYSRRFAGPKAGYRANPVHCANIDTNARINNHVINITSHLSSSDVFDDEASNGKGKSND